MRCLHSGKHPLFSERFTPACTSTLAGTENERTVRTPLDDQGSYMVPFGGTAMDPGKKIGDLLPLQDNGPSMLRRSPSAPAGSSRSITGFLADFFAAISRQATDALRPRYGRFCDYEGATPPNAEMAVWTIFEYR